MRTLLFSLGLLLCSAVPALALQMVLTVDGITYEGVSDDKRMVYRVDGKDVATQKYENSRVIFVDMAGKTIGTAVLGEHIYKYYDQDGKFLGTQEINDDPYARDLEAVYKDAQGNIIGSARGEGCFRMYFRNAMGEVIGSADTNALPMRPIPVEHWLKKQR